MSVFINPLESVKPKAQKILLWVLGISTFLLFVAIGILDQPLKNNVSPNGIVSFELAGSFNQSQKILSSWNHQAKLSAIQSLVVDYLFLISYSFFFAFVIFKLSEIFKKKNLLFLKLGIALAWLQFAAAVFDAFENYFLLRLMFGSTDEILSQLAFYFASVKFLLILAGFIYMIFALYTRLVSGKTGGK